MRTFDSANRMVDITETLWALDEFQHYLGRLNTMVKNKQARIPTRSRFRRRRPDVSHCRGKSPSILPKTRTLPARIKAILDNPSSRRPDLDLDFLAQDPVKRHSGCRSII